MKTFLVSAPPPPPPPSVCVSGGGGRGGGGWRGDVIRSALAYLGANLSRSDIAKAEIKVSSDENPSLSLSKTSSLQPGFSPKNVAIGRNSIYLCFVVVFPPFYPSNFCFPSDSLLFLFFHIPLHTWSSIRAVTNRTLVLPATGCILFCPEEPRDWQSARYYAMLWGGGGGGCKLSTLHQDFPFTASDPLQQVWKRPAARCYVFLVNYKTVSGIFGLFMILSVAKPGCLKSASLNRGERSDIFPGSAGTGSPACMKQSSAPNRPCCVSRCSSRWNLHYLAEFRSSWRL